MAASKVQNVDEARRWIEDGEPLAWIVEEYRRKYNIETTVSMWSNFRSRQGIETRHARNDNLIPWKLEDRDRRRYAVEMLRKEARRRARVEMSAEDLRQLRIWKRHLAEGDLVVHYAPGSEKGFYYVKRRPEIDKDLIREPGKIEKMTRNRPGRGQE